MKIRKHDKSTIKEIEQKFDNEVHKYDNLEKGQLSAMDSVIIMDTVSRMAGAVQPNAKELLDIGSGAGNYTLKTVAYMPQVNCTLVDLSAKMLQKAKERVAAVITGSVNTLQGDIRALELPEEKYDVAIAATSLHHLREDHEWELVFAKVFKSLKKGGAFFISDIVLHDHEKINQAAWKGYWDYLYGAGGEELKQWVFEQIDKEDSPQTLNFQTNLMWKTGFENVEVLYRNSVFAAFVGVK
jgi:tRNA (cmo5U34)-methyltransferase